MRYLMMVVATLVVGCTMPTSHTDSPMQRYDKDTEFAVTDRRDGFTLSIVYARYQMIPETDALALACRQALTALAYEIAEQRGRRIQRVEEQRIKISFGRNGLTGVTSCSATAPVDWQ